MSELRLHSPILSPPTVRSSSLPAAAANARQQRAVSGPSVLRGSHVSGACVDGSSVVDRGAARRSVTATAAITTTIDAPPCSAVSALRSLVSRPVSQATTIRNPQLVDTQRANGMSVAQEITQVRGRALAAWNHPHATTEQRNAISRGVRDLDKSLARVNRKELAMKRTKLDSASDDTVSLFAALDLLLKMCAAFSSALDASHPVRR